MRREAGDLPPVEPDMSGAYRKKTNNALNDGGAAGGVASHQRYHFVIAHVERYAAQDMRGAAKGVDVLDFQQHARRLLRSGRERNTEENIGDVLVRLDFLRRPVGEERTFMHHHNAIRITKNHIHVVLDDYGSHRAGAHYLGHSVHDLRLVARAHAARRFVEKQKLRSQRIGDRYIEQLALALRQSARGDLALVAQAELREHFQSFVADGAIVIRE